MPAGDDTMTIEQLRLLYPSVPNAALVVYLEAYIELGDKAGWAAVRAEPNYDLWFPGNMTESGEVRYSEAQYGFVRESYRDVFRSVNLDPSLFEDRVIELMEGEVSTDEFARRVNNVYDRVISASDSIKEYYASEFGITGMTTEALLAGALDPTIGDQILSGQLSMAEVGGEALESGFNLTIGRVEELVEAGMNRDEANELFQEAENLVPILDVLARRHNDPDDDFDVEDFVAADFFKNPEQNLRMRRMMSQERSMFGARGSLRREQSGAVTGLLAE